MVVSDLSTVTTSSVLTFSASLQPTEKPHARSLNAREGDHTTPKVNIGQETLSLKLAILAAV